MDARDPVSVHADVTHAWIASPTDAWGGVGWGGGGGGGGWVCVDGGVEGGCNCP